MTSTDAEGRWANVGADQGWSPTEATLGASAMPHQLSGHEVPSLPPSFSQNTSAPAYSAVAGAAVGPAVANGQPVIAPAPMATAPQSHALCTPPLQNGVTAAAPWAAGSINHVAPPTSARPSIAQAPAGWPGVAPAPSAHAPAVGSAFSSSLSAPPSAAPTQTTLLERLVEQRVGSVGHAPCGQQIPGCRYHKTSIARALARALATTTAAVGA
jgi:hypothetical protein